MSTRRSALLPTLLGLSLMLGGLPAHAQSPIGEDQVNLKNGGMVRGRIVELIPDESVTIVSAASGQSKTFPWAEVAGVERSTDKPAAPAPAPAPAPTREPEPTTGPGAPRLHIEPTRDTRVDMFEITAEVVAQGYNTTVRGIAYRPVCTSPCGQIIDGSRGTSFFFGGDGVTTSRRFTLSGQSGDLVATVKPGRRGLRVGGLAMLSIGAAGVLTGGILYAFAGRERLEVDNMGNLVPSTDKPNYTPATAILVTGAALLVGGIVMYVLGRTTYKFSQRGLARRLRLTAG